MQTKRQPQQQQFGKDCLKVKKDTHSSEHSPVHVHLKGGLEAITLIRSEQIKYRHFD